MAHCHTLLTFYPFHPRHYPTPSLALLHLHALAHLLPHMLASLALLFLPQASSPYPSLLGGATSPLSFLGGGEADELELRLTLPSTRPADRIGSRWSMWKLRQWWEIKEEMIQIGAVPADRDGDGGSRWRRRIELKVVQIGAARWGSMWPFSPVHPLSIFFPSAGRRLGVRHLLNMAPRPKANETTGPSAGDRGALRGCDPDRASANICLGRGETTLDARALAMA